MLLTGFLTRTAALAAVVSVGLSGCSRESDPPAPVSSAELQKAIATQLAEAGTPSTWVNCPKDLPGEVSATTRCEVQFSSDNSVTALLTTTQVVGDKVTWEITSAQLTKDQLAKRVSGLAAAQAVTCDSGLDDRVDAWTQCQITRAGANYSQVIEVKSVKGLVIDLALTQALSGDQLAQRLLRRVPPESGRRPESAVCQGDLAAVSGSTTECVVTFSAVPGQDAVVITYGLTVTSATNDGIEFDFAAKRATGGDDSIDYCHGCPG